MSATVQPAQVCLVWAGSLFGLVESMPRHLKPYLPVSDLIAVLQQRGMTVDEASAERWLRSVGYYRLSGYWYLYRTADPNGGSRRSDAFQTGANFEAVAAMYEFDRKLRGLMLDGLERVEVALRSGLNEELGIFGPLGYMNPNNFRSSFDHSKWLDTAKRRVSRASKSSASIQHYQKKYGADLPLWVLSDHLDFADCSRLLEGLPARPQWSIAERLGIHIDLTALTKSQRGKALKLHPLVRWFEQLCIVRNTCAHHSRLWNRSFTPASTTALRTIPSLATLPEGQSGHLYGAVLVTAQILTKVSPGSSWPTKFRSIVNHSLISIPGRDPAELGCPLGWDSTPLMATVK